MTEPLTAYGPLARHPSLTVDLAALVTAVLVTGVLVTVLAGFQAPAVLGLGLAAIATAVLTVAAVVWDTAGERAELLLDWTEPS